MNFVKKLHIMAIIIYTIGAFIIGQLTKIHFIHIFNAFMLSGILYNLLDWRYGEIDE